MSFFLAIYQYLLCGKREARVTTNVIVHVPNLVPRLCHTSPMHEQDSDIGTVYLTLSPILMHIGKN